MDIYSIECIVFLFCTQLWFDSDNHLHITIDNNNNNNKQQTY